MTKKIKKTNNIKKKKKLQNIDAVESDEAEKSDSNEVDNIMADDIDLDKQDLSSESSEVNKHNLNEPVTQNKTKKDLEIERIHKRYKELEGKQLYIRFPARLPEDEAEFQMQARKISPLIVSAQKPRQKYARFCLLNFNTKEDRDVALKTIRKAIKEKMPNFEKLFVEKRKTENPAFIKKLVEKKLSSIDTKKTKAKLKRTSRKAEFTKKLTSSVVILNMPKTASLLQIRELFPTAVDIQVKHSKHKLDNVSTVFINLPSVDEARKTIRKPLSYEGIRLHIRYNGWKPTQNATKSDMPPKTTA